MPPDQYQVQQPESQSQPLNIRRIIIISLVVITAIVVMIVFLSKAGNKTITINAADGATISVSETITGAYEEIGTTSASFTTKQEGYVFFRVELGALVNEFSVLPDEANGQTISASLEELKTPEKVTEGALKDVLIEKDVIYGIAGSTRQLSSAGLTEFRPPDFRFIGLPFMQEIIWKDSSNFIYESFDGRVGQFVNGRNRGSSLLDDNDSNQLLGSYVAISKHADKPLVLLGLSEISVGSVIGAPAKDIAEIFPSTIFYFSSDDQFVYYAADQEPGAFVSEGEDDAETTEETVVPEETATLLVTDYEGGSRQTLEIPGAHTVAQARYLASSNTIVVLTDVGLTYVDLSNNNDQTSFNFHDGAPIDMYIYNNQVYLFDEEGIWLHNRDSGQNSLVVEFSSLQNYFAPSVEANPAGPGFIYSVIGNDDSGQTTSGGAVFSLQ